MMARSNPYASDPYFFVIDLGCGPKDLRNRHGGFSSKAASPLQHKVQNRSVRDATYHDHIARKETTSCTGVPLLKKLVMKEK